MRSVQLMNDLDFGQALKEIGEAAALLRKEGASKVCMA